MRPYKPKNKKDQFKNDGEASQKIFEDRLNTTYGKNVFVERLPDTKSIKGLMKNGFIQSRPSDYIVTLKGEMFYAEVKSCSNPNSFPFGNFEPEQWRAMKRQVCAGGQYRVYIHNIITNEWFLVEGREILSVEEQGKKSIKWSSMQKWII